MGEFENIGLILKICVCPDSFSLLQGRRLDAHVCAFISTYAQIYQCTGALCIRRPKLTKIPITRGLVTQMEENTMKQNFLLWNSMWSLKERYRSTDVKDSSWLESSVCITVPDSLQAITKYFLNYSASILYISE